jgi:hypothetical protein
MEEIKKVYITGKRKDSVLFSPFDKIEYFKNERHVYVITKDLKIEYKGILYNGCCEDLRCNLDLKQFKIEIS